MKNTFSEYYPIDTQTLKEIWDKGIFCYDANVLLNLYRYSNDTRNKIFENIEYFIPRTIMPYQACYEYHKNRREVESNLINSYDKIIDIINKTINSLDSGELAGYRKHCALDIKNDIIKPLTSASDKIIKKLEDKKDNHTTYVDVVAIHDKITSLFDGIISPKFTDDELKKIYAEGKIRYEKKIPPGFADEANKKNNGENSLYGDLVIWKHLIGISKEKNADIIFVTDDRKKDWWDIYNGQTKGALPELFREFKEQTSQRILIYSVEDFMKYAPEYSTVSVPKKVINEIEEFKKVDERRENYLGAKSLYEKLEQLGKQQSRLYESIAKQPEWLSKINEQSQFFKNIAHQYEWINKISEQSELHKNIARQYEWMDKLKETMQPFESSQFIHRNLLEGNKSNEDKE